MDELQIITTKINSNYDILSHAYLVNTDDNYDRCEILNFIKKIVDNFNISNLEKEKVCQLIDSNSFSDLKIITPNGLYIKKEQILELKKDFKTKSRYNEKRFYVIEYAENLNNYSFNSLLKFLEEPDNDVISFLITKNLNLIAPTIISRCQLINLKHNKEEVINNDYLELSEFFLSTIIVDKNKSIAYLKDLYSQQSKDLVEILKNIVIIIYNYVKYNKFEDFFSTKTVEILKKSNKNVIVKYIDIFENYISLFNKNYNIKLLLDKLIMEISEVK